MSIKHVATASTRSLPQCERPGNITVRPSKTVSSCVNSAIYFAPLVALRVSHAGSSGSLPARLVQAGQAFKKFTI